MTEATPTTTPVTTTAAPAAPAGHGIAWLPADADADLVGHIQNKAWASPVDAVKGHRELEKLLGADRAGRTLVIPTDDAAPEWAGVYERLGRPATPESYKLPVPEGSPPEFAAAAAKKFHELGLNTKQAQELATWWNQTTGGMSEAQAAMEQSALQAEHQALAADWGQGPDAAARREIARRAAVHLGLDAQAIDALEKVGGYAKTMKALAKVGDMLKEAGLEGATEVGAFGMTPEGARAKRSQLMADADFRGRAMDPNSKEWAEIRRLDAILAGG